MVVMVAMVGMFQPGKNPDHDLFRPQTTIPKTQPRKQMNKIQARKMVQDLQAAGVTFHWRAFWYASGATIPDDIDLASIPSDDWDAERVPTFPILPETHPQAEFLDAVQDLYHSSTIFSNALHEAAADIQYEEQEREFLLIEQQADEALANMNNSQHKWGTIMVIENWVHGGWKHVATVASLDAGLGFLRRCDRPQPWRIRDGRRVWKCSASSGEIVTFTI